MSKVFIVSSSMRKSGNSDLLAEEFAKGARESGNEVEKVEIYNMELKFCLGCLHCQSHNGCVIKDSVGSLLRSIQNSDVLVFATPIYYYEMCGQLKTFLDRLNPLFGGDNKFKDVYLLCTATEDDESAMDGAITGVQGWISCFDGVSLVGTVFAGGVTNVGDIKTSAALKLAFNQGKAIK